VPKSKPLVFLDSNVIFSGLYSPRGAPGIILERFVNGSIRVAISQQVLQEVIRTIKEKLPDTLPALRRFLVNTAIEVVADPKPPDVKRWAKHLYPGDAAILAAAITARPDYFVTGDRHFIDKTDIVKEAGLTIVTPAQFLKLLESDASQQP
jgi:uncharacterized protein